MDIWFRKRKPKRTMAGLAATGAAVALAAAAHAAPPPQTAAGPQTTAPETTAPKTTAPVTRAEQEQSGYGAAAAWAEWTAGTQDMLWTGPYLGVSAGYAFGESEHYYNRAGHGTATTDPSGGAFAATAGYNLHWPSGVVAGLEADIGTMALDDDTKLIFDDHFWTTEWGDWFATLRARIGYAMDDLLIFATAGVGWFDSDEIVVGNTPQEGASNDGALVAATLGLGLEKRLTERLSLKGEWLYFNFAEEDGVNVGPGGDLEDWNFDGSANLIRVGVNVAF